MDKEKKKYPIGAEHYALYEVIGTGASATVHRARCIVLDEIVAIKILDFERSNCDLTYSGKCNTVKRYEFHVPDLLIVIQNNVSREAQTMVLIDHPNVLKSHCSFISDHNLWVVMPYLSGGSCLHILKAAHPDGFEEVIIATVLREVLKGLEYLHQHGHIHRDVKAGNILIDSRGAIKLGDFGVSACLFDSGDRQRTRNTFVGTPCWMAPEVMEQLHGYDCKADIWSFGITAIELARGHAPFSKYPPMKVLLLTLQNAPPGLDNERDQKFSKHLRQMIASCLVKDPSKRPSAKKLLKHSFFKQARSSDFIARTLLEGLPPLGERIEALKRKEEDMLAQKKMPDGEKEEISQNEYNRGISSWNFDLEDMKAQAALIPDDDIALERGEDANGLSSSFKQISVLQHQSSFASHNSEVASDDNAHASPSAVNSTVNLFKNEKNEDRLNMSASASDLPSSNMSPRYENQAMTEKLIPEISVKSSEGASTSANQSPRDKLQNQLKNMSAGNLDKVDVERTAKGSKTSVNDDEVDDKAKNSVIQQKGRFKVTSESIDLDKVVVPVPALQKSHSVQVIVQTPTTLSSSSLTEAAPLHPLASTYYPELQSILQTNILEREHILRLMKRIALGDSLDAGSTSMNTALSEKISLEAAHDRERELLNEITDLQSRLLCAQEELQRYRTENARLNSN